MKRILVINGNSKAGSLSEALAEAYARAASAAGHEVTLVHARELSFDPVFRAGYGGEQPLEPDLVRLQQQIREARHLVLVYPVWWGTVPALLKGLLDRVLLPGFAFRYRKGNPFPEQLLKGRSARLLVTMDTPPWYYRLVYRAPAHAMMKKTVLEFCGVSPVAISDFGPVLHASPEKRQQWLDLVSRLGAEAA